MSRATFRCDKSSREPVGIVISLCNASVVTLHEAVRETLEEAH